jgi:hypothetical protein
MGHMTGNEAGPHQPDLELPEVALHAPEVMAIFAFRPPEIADCVKRSNLICVWLGVQKPSFLNMT